MKREYVRMLQGGSEARLHRGQRPVGSHRRSIKAGPSARYWERTVIDDRSEENSSAMWRKRTSELASRVGNLCEIKFGRRCGAQE